MRTLVLFAHPRTDRSEVNRPLFEAAQSVDGVTAIDLYAHYPTFDIDIEVEQRRLLAHDAVIFQHPLYWYSTPAILKEWQDLVLEYGFAYGQNVTALTDKLWLNVVTAGAVEGTYCEDGFAGRTVKELFLPMEKTAKLCHMRFLAPWTLYAAGRAADEGRVDGHVAAYRTLLSALVEDRFDVAAAEAASSLEDVLDTIVRAKGGV